MWEEEKIGEKLNVIRGVSFPKNAKKSEYKDGRIACLRTANVQKEVDWSDLWFIDKEHVSREEQIVQLNDILISTANSLELLGKVSLVRKLPYKSTLGTFIVNIRVPDGNNPTFIYYQLCERDFLEQVWDKASTTTNISNLSTTKLKDITLKFPPLPTQNRIVEKIEELFSELDNGVKNLKKAQQQLKTYRQAVLKDAFEGKLTKEWREQQDDLPRSEELLQQIKAERIAHRERELAEWEKEVEQWEKDGKLGRKPRKPRKAKDLDPVDNQNLANLPSSWCYSRLQNLCTKIVDCLHSTPKFTTQGKYCIDTTCIFQGKINFEKLRYVNEETFEDRNRRLIPKKGDVIFAREGTVGTSVILQKDIDICLGQRVMIFRNIKSILPAYFMNVLQDPQFINRYKPLIGGTTSPHLNIGDIRALIVPVPSKQEQKQILQEIESRVSVIDQLEQTIKENLQKAEALRQSILKKAFGGELVREEIKVEEAEITPFQQMQMIGVLINILKEEYDMAYGEMTLAKYLFLIDRIKKYRTGFNFKDWHWGPYDPAIRKRLFSKQTFFRKNKEAYSVIELKENRYQLFKYHLNDQDTLETGVREVAEIISKFKGRKKTSRQLELLATVVKVVENESSTDLETVRTGMKNWKTPKTDYKNKAEKFSEKETAKCLDFIKRKEWNTLLM